RLARRCFVGRVGDGDRANHQAGDDQAPGEDAHHVPELAHHRASLQETRTCTSCQARSAARTDTRVPDTTTRGNGKLPAVETWIITCSCPGSPMAKSRGGIPKAARSCFIAAS